VTAMTGVLVADVLLVFHHPCFEFLNGKLAIAHQFLMGQSKSGTCCNCSSAFSLEHMASDIWVARVCC